MQARLLCAALVCAVPLGASAQEPRRIEVKLSNFAFDPSTITLQHGQHYVLALRNDAKGGHDFEAREFFAAAAVDPADKGKLEDGKVELEGGAGAQIGLTAPARPGSYKLRCTHFLHSTFGMTGTIVVR